MSKTLLLAAIMLGASPAFAEEVIVRPGVAAPDREVVRDHDRAGGCDSKTVHKENDAGDSKTVTKTDCD